MRAYEDLLRRIAAGDEAALAALYDGAHGLVRGLALRILRDPADAEEAALEVFVQVWRTAGRYDPRVASPAAWLTMLAKSRALDKLRSKRSRLAREGPLPEAFEPEARLPSPEEEAGVSQERARLRAALSCLSEEQRAPLELAYYEGYSQSELAHRLGQPLGTIKTRMRMGLKHLRAHLASA